MNGKRFRSLALVALTAVALVVAATGAPAQVLPTPARPGEPVPAGPATPVAQPSIGPVPGVSASPTTALPKPSASEPSASTPSPAASGIPGASAAPAPNGAAPVPSPTPAALIRFTGQLLDLRNGYVFFTTADAFKVSPALRVVDFDSGGPTALVPSPRLFARATLDPESGSVVELALTKRRLPTDAAYQQAYAQAHVYAAAGSPTVVAPELLHGVRLTGRPVAVTFFVQVPPTTPLTDNVYLSTDASGWVANAMRMDRIDALHYRLTRTYASGTKFAYRYTRGSWNSVEVGENGLQGDTHQFFVPEVDAKRLSDVVYRWSDQNPTAPQVGPDTIPTPFNPNPFGAFPTTVRQGLPAPSPTPRP
jgi:hypothetical protein